MKANKAKDGIVMIKDMFGNVRYKIGLHIHTNISDGCVSPEECAKIYKDAGFDAIAITDHWKYGKDGEISGLKIYSGCEYNLGASDTAVDVMHIVGVFMDEEPSLDRKTSSRQETIDEIKRCGGMAIFAHPAWSLNGVDHAKELSGFGSLEIYNTVSEVGQSNRAYSGYIVDLLANEGIIYPLIATDDVHYYNGEDDAKAFIMVKADSLDKKDIMKAIENCDFYATQGPELHVRREGDMIIADCSECQTLAFMSNCAWAPDRMIRGSVTHAEYKIKEIDRWVRVEVMDKDGKYAWSNIIKIK